MIFLNLGIEFGVQTINITCAKRGHPVRVKHDSQMCHGQNRGVIKKRKLSKKR